METSCIINCGNVASLLKFVSRLGFEPRTNSLKGYCSTVELQARISHDIKFGVWPQQYCVN